MAVINRIAGFADDMTAWRRHLHQNPELGLDCFDTAQFVVARLREMGVDEIHEGIARTGIVAVINGQGQGPVTGLRADMDALPIQEASGASWASTRPGKMHACGHDGHTAMLLGAARYLAETRNFKGRAVLIFQPAEETIGGGRIMVEEGMMDRFGIEEVYAIHTDPFAAAGQLRTCEGPIMAGVEDWRITVKGVGGHAAYPHATRDPIPAALAIGQALMAIPARESDTFEPLVVSMTTINAGEATNVIPDTATLTGTVRSFNDEQMARTLQRIEQIASQVADGYGVAAHTEFVLGYPATINHAAQARYAAEVAREISADVLDTLTPEMGAEDFSFMLQSRPGAFLFLGQGEGPSVHHPEFDFNDAVAPVGASYLARLVERRGQ